MTADQFNGTGVATLPALIGVDECAWLTHQIATLPEGRAGSRRLLRQPWCHDLAQRLRMHPAVAVLIPATHRAVQCTYFEKSQAQNWLVALHQDVSIAVAERVAEPALGGWSEKEGVVFVRAPLAVLEHMVALRLHLDPCGRADGALKVIPGSHIHGYIDAADAPAWREQSAEQICPVPVGGGLLLRPLLLHSSSRATGSSQRRVLHFVYGPPVLPHGLCWAEMY